MMRIAIFHNRYRERGGEDAVVEAQVELLVKGGHEVRLFGADNREEIRGVSGALRAGRRARWNPEMGARLASWLRARAPDATIGYTIHVYELDDDDVRRALGDPPVEHEPRYRRANLGPGQINAGLFDPALSQVDIGVCALKRRFRVKDSGDIIPGHGGLMDRLDSLVFGVLFLAALGLVHAGGGAIAAGALYW